MCENGQEFFVQKSCDIFEMYITILAFYCDEFVIIWGCKFRKKTSSH